jgi:hypothetical protein
MTCDRLSILLGVPFVQSPQAPQQARENPMREHIKEIYH